MLPGYWQQTFGARPRSRRRGRPGRHPGAPRRAGSRAAAAPCCAVHGLHRLLLQHRTGRPLRRPRLRRSTPSTCTSAGGRGGTARPRTSPPTWPATTPNWSARWTSSTPNRRGDGAHLRALGGRADRRPVAGPAAPPRRDARGRRRHRLWCSTARGWICTGRPIPARRPHRRRDRARCPAAQEARACARRPRAATARRLHRDYARRVRLQPGLEADRRIPGHVRLDQRDPTRRRPRCTAGSTSVCPT